MLFFAGATGHIKALQLKSLRVLEVAKLASSKVVRTGLCSLFLWASFKNFFENALAGRFAGSAAIVTSLYLGLWERATAAARVAEEPLPIMNSPR